MDRIEYEEWALKAVDPTLGPKLIVGKGEDGKESQEVRQKDPQGACSELQY